MATNKSLLSVVLELNPSLVEQCRPDVLLDSLLQFMAAYRLLSPQNQTKLWVCLHGQAAHLLYPLPNTADSAMSLRMMNSEVKDGVFRRLSELLEKAGELPHQSCESTLHQGLVQAVCNANKFQKTGGTCRILVI